jgi:SAM-dependent methyltransferase
MARHPLHKHGPMAASGWVRRYLTGARAGGRLLDIACGWGRHVRLALDLGFTVTGIDRDLSALADVNSRPGLDLIEADLENGAPFPLQGRTFDAVIVTNYLWRPILADIVDCVAGDGILIYETFALGNAQYGGPSRPEFLLRPNELITAVEPKLTVIAFEHVTVTCGWERVAQRIAAVGPRHAWIENPPRSDLG